MTIKVSADDPECAASLKTYAEYRVFSALSRYATRISFVDVRVAHLTRTKGSRWWQCTVTARIAARDARPVRSVGRFPAQAVDRAAERVGGVIGRALAADVSHAR